MTTLRTRILRLAQEKPETRGMLLPIVAASLDYETLTKTLTPWKDKVHVDATLSAAVVSCSDQKTAAWVLSALEGKKFDVSTDGPLKVQVQFKARRVAREFSTEEALKEYMKEHPAADPKNHSVKGEKDSGGEKEESKEDDKKPKEDAAEGGKVKVKVNEKELAERKPKIDSEDLSAYPDDAEADDLDPEHREEIKEYKLTIVGNDARQAVEIARKIRSGIKKGSDICKLNPPVCEGNLGLTRDRMPQIDGDKSPKAMLASSDPLEQKKGKAMVAAGADPDDDKTTLENLLAHLKDHGIKTSNTEVPVGALKATQSEIKADKVYGMADAHLKGKYDSIDGNVVVSRDGHILDGHHRWAALLTIDPKRKMKVRVIDMDMKDLLKESQALPGVYKADFEGNPLDDAAQKKYKEEAESSFSDDDKKKKKTKGKEAAMSDTTLRAGLIRLAYSRPEFRERILPLLREASVDPTVQGFLTILTGILTQYDQAQIKRESVRGVPNMYRLSHLLGAANDIQKKMSRRLDSSDPKDLEALKAAVNKGFTENFPPATKLIKMIDAFLTAGKVPNYPIPRTA